MRAIAVVFCLMFLPIAAHAEEIRLFAAGSLTGAFNAMIADYARTKSIEIKAAWGPSGILRDRLEGGEAFDIFASAALPHAQALTDKGLSGPSVLFVRNTLCAVVPAASAVNEGNLVAEMLKPSVRLGTSTPKADPGGDYTWELFRLIDKSHPGAFAALSGKAQQLFGGPDTTAPLNGRHRLGLALEEGRIDMGVYYCSGGKQMMAEAPGRFRLLALPSDLVVGAEYGLTLAANASPAAAQFALYLLSPKGQATLADYGFIPVALPTQH